MVAAANGFTRKESASMKALPKRKGNVCMCAYERALMHASMKALPKRKGNFQSSVTHSLSG